MTLCTFLQSVDDSESPFASGPIGLYLTGRGHTTDTWALEHRIGIYMALQLCYLGDPTTSSPHHCNVVAIAPARIFSCQACGGHYTAITRVWSQVFQESRPKPVLTEKDLLKEWSRDAETDERM